MTRIVVVSDTHVHRDATRDLPSEAWRHIEGADLVLHAGDVVSGDFLDRLADVNRIVAVLGNNDHDLVGVLPERREFELDGVTIAMVHQPGPAEARARRLQRWFPAADLVIYGHTHQPVNEVGEGDQWILNPGSPTQRRRAPTHTLAVIEAADGVFSSRIVDVR